MSIELSRDIERYCAAEVSFVPERFRLEARSIPDFACEVRKFVYQRTFLDNRIGQNPESYECLPLLRSVRAPLCIRLLPRVPDGETLVGPGVSDPRLWEPVVRHLHHSSPVELSLLAASAECPAPAFGDLGSKGSQRSPVGWHCVVVEEAGDDLLQPFTLFGYRLMHSPVASRRRQRSAQRSKL